MHDEVGFPHYLVDKEKFKKRFKKYDHVSNETCPFSTLL